MITPVLFYNLIIGIISTFQIFTQAYVMTSGRPGGSDAVLQPVPV